MPPKSNPAKRKLKKLPKPITSSLNSRVLKCRDEVLNPSLKEREVSRSINIATYNIVNYSEIHYMATFKLIEWLVDWILSQPQFAFDWDSGNLSKNLRKHSISCEEAESVFEQPESIRVLGEQLTPRVGEPRYGILGLTRELKPVFLCFTMRGTGIRVIHIRKMNKKERKFYVELCQK